MATIEDIISLCYATYHSMNRKNKSIRSYAEPWARRKNNSCAYAIFVVPCVLMFTFVLMRIFRSIFFACEQLNAHFVSVFIVSRWAKTATDLAKAERARASCE